MIQSFKCPSCAAPLEYEGKMMQKCSFCRSSVIVPSQMFYQNKFETVSDSASFDLSALTGKALKIAEIQREIKAGRKINAIKIFRETFDTGLKQAKDAVESMERGESIDISGMQIKSVHQDVQNTNPQNLEMLKKNGGSILGTIIIAVLIILGITAVILYFTLRRVENSLTKTTEIKSSVPQNSPAKNVAETKKTAVETLKFGGEGLGAGKFKDNRTIAVDKDGNIYSADYSGGRIQVFDAGGNFQMQISGDASKSVDALGADRKGNFFVLQGYDLNRFDAKSGEPTGKYRIDSATDFAVGSDGNIYVSTRRGEIQMLDSNGAKLRTIKPAKEFNIDSIQNLTLDDAGNFYLVEGRDYAIFKLSPEGKLLTRFGGKNDKSDGKLSGKKMTLSPRDLAVDSQGRIFVSNISDVYIFDTNGNPIGDFPTIQTFGLAFNEKDELFTASRPFVVKYKLEN